MCASRPADWWWTGDDGNRLALLLCGVCPARAGDVCMAGLPDLRPTGVIRAGVAYGYTGQVLTLCPCGYPVDNYRGGCVTRCRWCTGRPLVSVKPPPVRDFDEAVVLKALDGVRVLMRKQDRAEAVRRAAGWGWPDSKTAERLGLRLRSVQRIRRRHGIRAGASRGVAA